LENTQGIGKQSIEKSGYAPLLHEDKKLNAFALNKKRR
jgi:hypothetical protein